MAKSNPKNKVAVLKANEAVAHTGNALPKNYTKRPKTGGSFKGAVPGNLGDNTKPSTPQSQKQAVDYLKQGGILPPTEQARDYPVLTARTKRDIIAVLLKQKQLKLATWASRNLTTAANPLYIETVDDLIEAIDDGYDDPVDGIAGVEGVLDLIPNPILKKLLPELKQRNKRWGDWVGDWLRGKRHA